MSDTRTVTAVQARKSLLKAFQVKRPLFLWGPPGIGKSELVENITRDLMTNWPASTLLWSCS